MDCARLLDENSRAGASTTLHSQPAPERVAAPEPQAHPNDGPAKDVGQEVFERHWDRGVTALLKKDYRGAWDAFSAANALQPGNPTVEANLERLRALGHGESNKDHP